MKSGRAQYRGYLAALCTFEIYFFSTILSFSSYIYFALQVLLIGICLIQDKEFLKIGKFEIILLTYIIVTFATTLLNNVALITAIRNTVQLLVFIIYARKSIKRNLAEYFKAFSNVLMFLTIANTAIAVLIYPNALYYDGPSPLFLLGGDNTSCRIYLLNIMFAYFDDYLNKKKGLKLLFSCAVMALFVFVRDIGTGKLCVAVMIIGILLFVVRGVKVPKKVVFWTIIIHLALFVILVILNRTNLFSFIIIRFLKRDLTLTERFIIWKITIDRIINSPIIGYGYISGDAFEKLLPSIIGVNAHNTYLMVFYIGGIALFIPFILLHLVAAYHYDLRKHNKYMAILPITLFAMMLRAQVEGADMVWIIYLLFFLKNSNIIEKALLGVAK